MRPLIRLLRDEIGATMVETTLVFPLVLLLTFGLVEFGRALWEYNTAEKATAAGARYLATLRPTFADPSITQPASTAQLLTIANDCFVTTSATAGTSCGNLPDGDPTTWSSSPCTVNQAGTVSGSCNTAIMKQMWSEMTRMAPFLTTADYSGATATVVLRGTKMGFVGRPCGAVPLVTVQLNGLTFNFVTGSLLGVGAITMPPFTSALVAEDQHEGASTCP